MYCVMAVRPGQIVPLGLSLWVGSLKDVEYCPEEVGGGRRGQERERGRRGELKFNARRKKEVFIQIYIYIYLL